MQSSNKHLAGRNTAASANNSEGQYTGKRLELLEAALAIISTRDVKESTITDIARNAGVVDSVIYHYFKNKEDLIFSVLDLLLRKSLEELDFHFKGIMGPVSKLGKLIWYHLYMNDTDGTIRLRKMLLLEARGNENFLSHASYATLKRYTNIMDTILEEGIKERYFRDDLNIPLVRTMIFGFLDEEALISTASNDLTKTLPDFEDIMQIILAMIEQRPVENGSASKQDKYLNILEAAKKLFAQKGFKATTMIEVAARAGVAEGTIYEYFKNKEDLLLSITRKYFGLHKLKLDDAFNFKSAFDKLRQVLWHHFSIFAADKDLVAVFLKETKLSTFFYPSDAYKVFFKYHDKIIEVLDEGKATGEFRQDVSDRLFRTLVMGSLANLYNRWYYRHPIPAAEYTKQIHQFIELLCRAVASPAHSNGL